MIKDPVGASRIAEVLQAIIENAADGRIGQDTFDRIIDEHELPSRYYSVVQTRAASLGITVVDQIEVELDADEYDTGEGETKGWENDGFGTFLSRARHRVLRSEEVVILAKRIEAGQLARRALELTDSTFLTPQGRHDLEHRIQDGNDARNEFAHSNLRLVISIASRFQGKGLPLEDLVQEGWFGLARAIDKFDYKKGFKFSTYATWWITQALQRAVTNQGSAIRLPMQAADDLRRLKRLRSALRAELHRTPTVAELASAAGLDETTVAHLLRYRYAPRSLDAELISEGMTLVDVVASPLTVDPAQIVEQLDEAAWMYRLVEELPAIKRDVLIYRFGLDPSGKSRSYENVAALLGCGPRRVRRIEREALSELMKLVSSQDGM